MVRPTQKLAAALEPFVLVRVTDMRGIDLDTFRFNYDLTLAVFAMNADGTVYTTYAGRDAMQQEGRRDGSWTEDDQYRWPDPLRVGLRLDKERQTVVADVVAGSPAAKAGLRAGGTRARRGSEKARS